MSACSSYYYFFKTHCDYRWLFINKCRAFTVYEVIHTPSSGNLLKELVSRLSVSNVRCKMYPIAWEENERDDVNGCKLLKESNRANCWWKISKQITTESYLM